MKPAPDESSRPPPAALPAPPSARLPSEVPFEEMRRYVGFDAREEEILRGLLPLLAPRFPEIVERFYETLLRHDGARGVVERAGNPIARLKDTLLDWLQGVFTGPYDAAYVEKRLRIGRTHVRIALPQHYMFTAMNGIRNHVSDLLVERITAAPARLQAARGAVNRILDLDLALMLHTYSESLLDRLRLASREFLSRIVENDESLILAIDAEGRITLFNRGAERVTGYARGEILGAKGIDVLLAPEERKAAASRFQDLLSKGTPSQRLTPIRTKEGRVRQVLWTSGSFADEEGRGLVVSVGQDLTERIRLEEEMRQQEGLATLGRMGATIAHEIKNPLAGIRGAMQILRTRLPKEAPEQAILGEVVERIDRLNTLILDLLAFARPARMNKVQVTVGALLDGTVRAVRGDPLFHQVRLEVAPAAADVFVFADPLRLQQAIVNLVLNAAEAAGRSGVVRVDGERAPGGASIRVLDNGPGFPEETLPRVFQPFFTTKHRGTGLGLAVTQQIVRAHGGRVDARNRPEGGACVEIYLPDGG